MHAADKVNELTEGERTISRTAYFHLPGLFEFQELYRIFLRLFREHRESFYDWCEIISVYGAPAGCRWDGGRAGFGEEDPAAVAALMREYGISARLTFSNSLLREEDLRDAGCNRLCALFEHTGPVPAGVILSSVSRPENGLKAQVVPGVPGPVMQVAMQPVHGTISSGRPSATFLGK